MAAEDALNVLVQNVKTQLVDHCHLVSRAKKELELLQGEANLMVAWVKDMGNQSMRGEVSKQCEREVRDVAYDAHDIVDEGLTRAAHHYSTKLRRFINPKYTSSAYKVKSFRQETIGPLFDNYDIRRIRPTSSPPQISNSITTNHKLQITPPGAVTIVCPKDEASTSRTYLDFQYENEITPPEEVTMLCPKGEASTSGKFIDLQFEDETCPRRGSVVGFTEEADTIIKLLCEESKQLDVVCIVAGPGMGKTTLARKIYEDKRIKYEFPMVIWVEVSQNYEKMKVYRSILESLTEEDTSSLGDDKLASTIKVYLQNQKFLLFLDGVGNAWEDIEAALPKNNRLGKVLMTSRHNKVAVKANCRREPYKLGILDADKSWELLQLQVFDNLNDCPTELDPLGRIIAGGCRGVPLAIVVIGGVLFQAYSASTEMNEKQILWEKVSNNVSKYFNDEGGRTRNAIAVSYNELPPDLRNCFLYLGNFPQDSPIPASRVIQLWIAEGFVQGKQDMSKEEVGRQILMELKDRSLVNVDKRKYNGSIKTCRIHGLTREFCKDESSPENLNLFQEVEMSSSQGTFSPSLSEIQNRRRITINSHVESFLRVKPNVPRAHSLLCLGKQDAVASLPDNTDLIPKHFTKLRVLHLNPIRLTRFPSKVAKLIHLRYISVSGDGDDFRVPKAISKLWNLETLIIETNLPFIEMRANIWKMEHLRHLKSKAAIVLDKKFKGTAGEHLQSFSRVSAKCFAQGALNRARNLKSLGIRGNLAHILESDHLREFQFLEKLKLVYDVSPGVASEKPLPCLPSPDRFPPGLRILKISGTFLTWHQIRVLENLPRLQVLILKDNAFDGKYWPALHGCFRTLETLIIISTGLVVWTSKQGYFPNLKCLVLKDCKELQDIPFELTDNLEKLHIECVSESAVESAKKIAEVKQNGFKLEIIDSGGRS